MVFPKLKIGDLVADIPIIQGGMGIGVSLSRLAGSVAKEGAVGIIAAAGLGTLYKIPGMSYLESCIYVLREDIRKAREIAGRGIIGVNIMAVLCNFSDMVKTSLEERVDLIISGGGVPWDLPAFLGEGMKTKLVPIISSAKGARVITKKWWSRYNKIPDAFIVEGPMAGGHLGFKPEQIDNPSYALENLIPEVLTEVNKLEKEYSARIPVIAAGGIYTGEDIYRFLELGASGVQMGTRFVATHECDADDQFKQCYVNSKPEDLMIIKSPVGMPGRAIRNKFIESVEAGERKPFKCLYHCITSCNCTDSPYCIALALANAKKGNLKNGFAFAGANAWRVDEIISVKELINSLQEEYDKVSGQE